MGFRAEGGVLVDHGDAVAAELAQLGGGKLRHVLPVEVDGAADFRLSGEIAHDGVGRSGLAAPGLADEADDLAALDLERGVADGVHRPGGGEEGDGEAVHFQERLFTDGALCGAGVVAIMPFPSAAAPAPA